MRIDVPWANGSVPVEVETWRVAGVLGANVETAEDPEGVLRAALAQPGASLAGFLERAEPPLLVVINDATRPTPSAQVLGVLREPLEDWLRAPARDLTFIIATGTHRIASPDEIEASGGI